MRVKLNQPGLLCAVIIHGTRFEVLCCATSHHLTACISFECARTARYGEVQTVNQTLDTHARSGGRGSFKKRTTLLLSVVLIG